MIPSALAPDCSLEHRPRANLLEFGPVMDSSVTLLHGAD